VAEKKWQFDTFTAIGIVTLCFVIAGIALAVVQLREYTGALPPGGSALATQQREPGPEPVRRGADEGAPADGEEAAPEPAQNPEGAAPAPEAAPKPEGAAPAPAPDEGAKPAPAPGGEAP